MGIGPHFRRFFDVFPPLLSAGFFAGGSGGSRAADMRPVPAPGLYGHRLEGGLPPHPPQISKELVTTKMTT